MGSGPYVSLAVVWLVGCSSGHPPDLNGLTDQVAVVGQPLTVTLDGTDADGGRLTYSFGADFAIQDATVTETPAGTGVFRWTPLAQDVGSHVFDFTVSDGSHDTTVSVSIDVRAASGTAPIFRQPLGTGTVIDVAQTPCMTIDVVVEDLAATQVTITDELPIMGAQLVPIDGLTATWMWCPTSAQVAAQDRYSLELSADDGTNPKTIKDYVIVLKGGATPGPHLVINEVDYDQPGVDSAEFIEVYNPGTTGLSLAGLHVVLVNGATSTVYSTIDLSSAGTLSSKRYLVIGGVNVVPQSMTAKKLDPGWTQDMVQNGSPDGIALVDDVTHVVVDALSYKGPITAATIAGFAQPVSLVEGMPLDTAVGDSNTAVRSLCRNPNGQDTNNAATDWVICATLTPGGANAL